MNKIIHIKERILYVAETQGISKHKFFKKLGVSSSGYREGTMDRPVVSDLLQDIVIKFKVNAHWLLTGEGEMYEESNEAADPMPTYGGGGDLVHNLMRELLAEKDKVIQGLERENKMLRDKVPKKGYEKQPRAGGDR